jgi:hypothetical protein
VGAAVIGVARERPGDVLADQRRRIVGTRAQRSDDRG